MDNRYQHLRENAYTISAEQKEKAHPCVIGNAECCTADAEVLTEDIELLLEGFRDGSLPIDILHDAIERAQLMDGRCPFLSEENHCTVYEQRPLICISNNGLYIPTNEINAMRIDQMRQNGRQKANVPYSWLGNKMCLKCHNACRNLPDKHPLKRVSVENVLSSQRFILMVQALATRSGSNSLKQIKDIPLLIAAMLGEDVCIEAI